LAASIFHYQETSIPRVKSYLEQHNIAVRRHLNLN
jgi:imidazole glycerol phosphate synthase subunit HisF